MSRGLHVGLRHAFHTDVDPGLTRRAQGEAEPVEVAFWVLADDEEFLKEFESWYGIELDKVPDVEKPLALTAADAEAVFDAAQAADRLVEEALLYRFHPRTRLLQQLVADGRIGELMYIYSGCTASVPPGYFRRDRATGGGALVDLGVFPLSAALMFGGAPERVYAEDVSLAATQRFSGDVIAQFETGQEVVRGDDLQIVGAKGRLLVKDPWFDRPDTVELSLQGPPPHGEPQSEFIQVDPEGTLGIAAPYAVARFQFDEVSTAIATGSALPFGREEAVTQARVIEALFESAAKAQPVAL